VAAAGGTSTRTRPAVEQDGWVFEKQEPSWLR